MNSLLKNIPKIFEKNLPLFLYCQSSPVNKFQFPVQFQSVRQCYQLKMPKVKAILLGVYENSDKNSLVFTPTAEKINSTLGGELEKLININGPLKRCKTRVFYNVSPSYPLIGVVGLGNENASYNNLEELDEKAENVRSAVASGVRLIRELGNIEEIKVDGCLNPKAASEGANLGLYYFDDLKSPASKKNPVKVDLLSNDNSDDETEWNTGLLLSNGQNLCRTLMENPANIMTPKQFANIAVDTLGKLGVDVIVRDEEWAKSMKMGSFLSVTNGSDEPAVFLEMHYNNAPNTKPLVFVGKGITFDSGGISLKPSTNMCKMRADMGGAANVLCTIFTLACKKAPVNIIGLTPLCENLPSGKATKPGDVVTAMNGKTIEVNNTDAEGRLILADALCYAHKFDPFLIMDIATLTGSMSTALGSAATGVFSTSTKHWSLLQKCGAETGDRMWRMPLFNHYTRQITDGMADVCNIGKYAGLGGCCIAAAFLREFVTLKNWMHLDMAGVADNKDEIVYLSKGMSGRPLRTLVKFVEDVFKSESF